MRVKRHLIASCIALLSILSFQLNGQISYGVKAGVNIASVKTNGFIDGLLPLDVKPITGLSVGVFADIPIGNNLSFMPELIYNTKGFKFNESLNVGEVIIVPIDIGATAMIKAAYVDIPLLVKYKFKNEGGISPYLFAGPSINYLTEARVKLKANIIADITLLNEKLPLGDFNRFAMAGVVGGGIELPVKSGKIILDARYAHDFSKAIRAPIIDVGVQNKGFAFNIGYALGF